MVFLAFESQTKNQKIMGVRVRGASENKGLREPDYLRLGVSEHTRGLLWRVETELRPGVPRMGL